MSHAPKPNLKKRKPIGNSPDHRAIRGNRQTRAVEPGEVIAAGTPIITLIDLSALYLRGFIPDLKIGM